MNTVRIGLVGCGTMGRVHAAYLAAGKVPQGQLTAICDARAENLESVAAMLPGVRQFNDPAAMFDSGALDAVIIATPHYSHPPLAIAAFEHGLHVLVEKPAGAYTQQVRQMNQAAERSGKVFSIMFNRRTRPAHRQLKELMEAGELGAVKRTVWQTTRWYRSQSYFDSCEWRATWKGEGGGVLLNQCIHQLDLWQWIIGMPQRLRAFCHFGKHHAIEVEDDVTAYLEYPGGATGVFIASTGDTPGTDRLEIVGDRGKLVMEDDHLTFWRTKVSVKEFEAQFSGGFGEPDCWKCEIPVNGKAEDHFQITSNWVAGICHAQPLIAPGVEGIRSLELANAMLHSTWSDDWVALPLDDEAYFRELSQRAALASPKKGPTQKILMDVQSSFKV